MLCNDLIGGGATVEIREALINLQTSFAFKRRRFQISYELKEFETQILPSLIAEISILSHPFAYNNSNIVRLEDICWEVLFEECYAFSRGEVIDPTKGGIIPVLVFEKMKHGDLHNSMLHAGKKLGMDARLQLCTEIVKAIAEMHLKSEF